PSTTISGASTALNAPQGVALDSSGNIYVVNNVGISVTVYPAGSSGNQTPSATISGANTGLDIPFGITLDSSGNIYVVNRVGGAGGAGSVTVYPAGSNGNVAPSGATIEGQYNSQCTGLSTPYPCCGGIGSGACVDTTGLNNPAAIALDSGENIYVTNCGSTCGGFGFDSVTVYPAGSSGNQTPSATISGAATGLDDPGGIALDTSGNIYVANESNNSITVYPAGSSGNQTPSATISGAGTGLNIPVGIAVDSSGNIYVANESAKTITVYPAGSSGNQTPSATISGAATGLKGPFLIAIWPNPAAAETATATATETASPTATATATPSCSPGETYCGPVTGCVNTFGDSNNCGACGNVCGGGMACLGGICACPPPLFDCGGGTCVDTMTDSGNCGFCGNACTGGTVCFTGACSCPPGEVSCGGSCTSTDFDPNNCGSCGNICPPATPNCTIGTCGP
ncbi:MAG TPA: hypothetical protein VMU16_11515, partial [Candidatus Binataceae bacterium]|nr:hypothetical protein [Candidatus Binataceae bacterium]